MIYTLKESVDLEKRVFSKGKKLSIIESGSFSDICKSVLEYVLTNKEEDLDKNNILVLLKNNYYLSDKEAPLILKAALIKLKQDKKLNSDNPLFN
jgi:hypothetical protein